MEVSDNYALNNMDVLLRVFDQNSVIFFPQKNIVTDI